MKYDYIIIGAGSAGAIIASRLSEDPRKSVLLVESGPDYKGLDDLPEGLKYGYASTKSNWNAEHNWQYMAKGAHDTPIAVPRGKVTGGSSAINGQIFLRGIPEDFDTWAEWGNDEWSYQELLPYMNKIETDTTYQEDSGDFHGSEGPIICHRFPKEQWQQGSKAWVDACLSAGFPECEDANAPGTTGVGPIPLNNPNGIRWSTALGHLSESRHRLNLTIRANVTVKHILFDISEGLPTATGIEVVSEGETFTIFGDEIVLCGGAIASPQLLMLSGIGPKDHLQQIGIDPIIDSPGVGENLRDHPLLHMLWKTKSNVKLSPYQPNLQTTLRYTAEGSDLHNDMIVYFQSMANRKMGIGPDGIPGGGYEIGNPVGIAAGLGLNLAKSKGRLKLTSNDYRDQPDLNYNMLDHEEDMRRCKDGIRMLNNLTKHSSLEKLIEEPIYPTSIDLETDEALETWIIKNVSTGHHVSCTAKMGPDSDPMAVVDQYGKVRGASNLRVGDASIMPDCVRANINVTVMSMAEKIADFIKSER